MSLTGTPFFVLTICLVVAATFVLLLLWNRLPGPRPVRVAGRLVLTGVSQVMAVLCVLVYVNNSMGPFYESWGDLFGTDNAQVAGNAASGGGANGGQNGIQTIAADKLTFTPSAQDTEHATATGPLSGITGDLYVWLPPQYKQASYAHTAFPVVMLLPGYPGTPQTWFSAMQAQWELQQLITSHQVQPMVLVAAKMNVLGNKDPGCADIPGVAKTATWLGKDVPTLIKDNFRVSTDVRQWAVMGYSAGAYCAVNLAVHYPDTFHTAVSLSGYNAPVAKLVYPNATLDRANNPLLVLKGEKVQPDVALLMAGTDQDGGTVHDGMALLNVLRAPAHGGQLFITRGGHNTRVWHKMLPYAFTWINTQMQGSSG
jgi:enterochelin esterase-like enzyme